MRVTAVTSSPAEPLAELKRTTDELLASDVKHLSAHEGMLLYLTELAEKTSTNPKQLELFEQAVSSLRSLQESLTKGTDVLAEKRGRFEWAHKSAMDGSGQPMMLYVPDSYDGKTPLPLVVGLHGLGGDHQYNSGTSTIPHLQVSVNGRGSPFYRAMGEVDVLEAIEFM
jgi:hypothetical protein